jgi:hypothetical protein
VVRRLLAQVGSDLKPQCDTQRVDAGLGLRQVSKIRSGGRTVTRLCPASRCGRICRATLGWVHHGIP